MAESNEWTIELGGRAGWGGYCPAYGENDYPYLGNDNQFSSMVAVDLTDPNILTQGPGVVNLTGGTEAGNVKTLISAILKIATSANVSFACGVNKVYKLSATAVSASVATITGGTNQVADSLLYYQSYIYVFWNDTGTDGNIAKVTPADMTIDVDWGSSVPTGAAKLEDAPHYGVVGGDNRFYFTNGKYVGKYGDDVLDVQALDFSENSEVVSIVWSNDIVSVAVNKPNVSGANFNQSAVYDWNTVSALWESNPVNVPGEIGALYIKNGRKFIWYKDGIDTSGYVFGYINGSVLSEISRYSGSLPNQNQVGEYKGHIAWLSDNKVIMFGSRDFGLATKLFTYLSPVYATAGAFASPFGTMLISSENATTGKSLAKASGYSIATRAKTIAYKKSGAGYKSQIDLIQIETEEMKTGAKVDFTITYDQKKSTQACTQIAYSAAKPTLHKIWDKSLEVEDFRLDTSSANGSATNPVEIRSVLIKGHNVPNN